MTQSFVKMPGGKRGLWPEISKRLPAKSKRYFEPFVGGGAVFFALAREQRFEEAVLSDVNAALMETYLAVQDDDLRLRLMRELSKMRWSEEDYYRIRSSRPKGLIQTAARFLYLNKCGYNGLVRVNAKGENNVPFGHHAKSPIGGRLFVKLYAAAPALAREKVTLLTGDFEAILGERFMFVRGDTIYCDPPYLPIEKGSFASYDASGFDIEHTERLAFCAAKCSEQGAHVLISNADTPDVRRIFKGFRIERVTARRSINSNGKGRGEVGEVLIQPRGQRIQ